MSDDAWAGRLVMGTGLAVYDGPGASASRHRHDAVQILACAARPVTVVFDDARIERHVVVVPSRTPHSVEGTGARVLVVLVEPAMFSDRPLLTSPHEWATSDSSILASLVEPTPAVAHAASVLERGNRLIEMAGGRLPVGTPGHLRPEVVRTIERINETAADVPNLSSIAADVALSPSRLSRVFAEEVGFPFRRFVLWSRLRAAALAVLEGADMTRAAAQAGFSDSAHFSRVFKSTFGLVPSEVLPILDIAALTD